MTPPDENRGPSEKNGGPSNKNGVTRLLLSWREGNAEAMEELVPIVYQELRQLARRYMRDEVSPGILQTTALVHEAYLRLVDLDVDWESRRHFFGVASSMMRRVLVDYARSRNAKKRGSGEQPLSLDENNISLKRSDQILALDDALKALATFDERKCQVVELRFFGGLTISETAKALDLSTVAGSEDGESLALPGHAGWECGR